MSRLFIAWAVLLCGCLGFGVLLGSSALVAAGAPVPKKDEPKKDEPPDLPFPALPKIVLPPGVDPELQRLEEELLKEREMILRQLGQLGRLQPGGLPNLPGVQPGARVAHEQCLDRVRA